MKRFAIALVLVAACKKHEAPVAAGSGSAVAVVVPDAPPAPWVFPASPTKLAGTKASPEAEEQVDATAVGPAVALRFVQTISDTPHDAGIEAPLALLLEGGGGKAWSYDATAEYPPADGDPAHKKLAKGTQLILPPLPAPRLFVEADSITRLRPRKPMLYLAKYKTQGDDGIANDYAILHDGDSLAVWRMTAANASIDVPPSWALVASLKLAKGAVVTAFGPTGAPASTVAAPPPPRTTPPLAKGTFDEAFSKGIYAGKKPIFRFDSTFSQWGVFRDDDGRLEVTRSIPGANAGTALKLDSPSAAFDTVTKIDVRDIDGDETDDATVTATWHDGEKHVTQSWIVGGPDAAMAVGATYVVGTPAPADDAVDFTPTE